MDEEVAKAKRAIDSSTTNDAVDQAKDSGVTTINNIQPESIEKLKRSKRLMILLQPKERHDQDGTTTQEEKDAAKAKVDEEATKAKQLMIKLVLMMLYTKLEIMK